MPVALEPHVELVAAVHGPRNERRAILDAGEDGITGVRLLLVRKYIRVSAALSRPRAKTISTRCGASARPTLPGLTVMNENRPSASHRPTPSEVASVAAALIGLPELDHRVGHGVAGAVEHAPGHLDGSGTGGLDQFVRLRREEPEREVRADCLRRRRRGHQLSMGVSAGPPRTTSNR